MSVANYALIGLLITWGIGAVIVGHAYWAGLSQDEVDRAVDAVAFTRIPAALGILIPVVRVIARPAWAALHGIAWPMQLWWQWREARRRHG